MTTWALFECVFYKFAAPCGRLFERSCGHFGSQQVSYRRNRRESAICKKSFQKCGVSSLFSYKYFFLSSFWLIQRNTIQTTTQCVCYTVLVDVFVFVDRRWKKLTHTDFSRCLWSIITLLSVWKFPILQPMLFSIHTT